MLNIKLILIFQSITLVSMEERILRKVLLKGNLKK